MKIQKQVKWRQPGPAHRDTIKKIVIGGIALLFFLSMAGCITGESEKVVRQPLPPKTPPAPSSDTKLASEPAPAKPVGKTSEPAAADLVKAETPSASPKKSIQNLKPEPVSAKKVDTTSEAPSPPAPGFH